MLLRSERFCDCIFLLSKPAGSVDSHSVNERQVDNSQNKENVTLYCVTVLLSAADNPADLLPDISHVVNTNINSHPECGGGWSVPAWVWSAMADCRDRLQGKMEKEEESRESSLPPSPYGPIGSTPWWWPVCSSWSHFGSSSFRCSFRPLLKWEQTKFCHPQLSKLVFAKLSPSPNSSWLGWVSCNLALSSTQPSAHQEW